MKAAVINCSKGYYNLGAEKAYAWARRMGYEPDYYEGDPGLFLDADLVLLSVIFSWDAVSARDICVRVKGHAHVECGGPGMYALSKWWKDQTGLECGRGLDDRFEKERGCYRAVFASRGCPSNCSFCIVSKIEGREQVLDWDFEPAPMLYDNNLSALPVDFQEHVIAKYLASGIQLVDANSGFEPKYFDGDCYARWKTIFGKSVTWRFAFDETQEEADAQEMARVLASELQRRKRVYVLVGNEPIEACYERAQKVLEWNCTPYIQPVMPLNALAKTQLLIRHDWTFDKLKSFQTYYNGFHWYSVPIAEYAGPRGRLFENLNHYQPYVVMHPRKRDIM